MKKGIWISLCVLLIIASGAIVHSFKKTEQNDECVELRWVVPVPEQNDAGEVLEKANKIIEEKIGARVTIEFIDKKLYPAKMKMYMASGDDFDLCFTGSWINSYEKAVESEGLLDVTDMLSDEMMGKIPEYLLKQAKINDRLYAVPNVQVATHPVALKIRKDMAEKYNLNVSEIKHINDIEPFLETVKKNEPDLIPYRISWGEGPWTRPVYEEVYDKTLLYIKKDGSSSELVFGQETNEYKESLEVLVDWYKKGYLMTNITDLRNDQLYDAENRYAVQITSWKPGVEAITRSNGCEYVFIPLHEPYMDRQGGLQAMTGVGINSKHPEKAVELIELMNTDKELYNLICYGIEGKHYSLTENNKVESYPDSGYKHDMEWVFGNQFNAYVWKDADDDVWEQTKEMDENSLKSPLVGFKPDTSAIRVELEQMNVIINEYSHTSLFMSMVSGEIEYIEEFKLKLKDAGQDKVMEELQRQVDDFFSEKK